MGVFDKWKEKLTERAAKVAQEQGTAAAKRAARKSAEVALAAAKGAGRKLEEAIFGAREGEPKTEEAGSASDRKKRAAEKKVREEEVGATLRDADRRGREREDRAAKETKLESDVDAELAALKKKLEHR